MSYRLQKQKSLFESKEHSDCTFIFATEKIKAHKLLLTLCSPVFERMLYGDLGRNEIYIEDIEPAVFRKFLQFIYTNAIEIDSVLEAWRLFYVSQKYFLLDLQDQCLAYVLAHLSITNLLMCYEFASLYGRADLSQQCLEDICIFANGLLLCDQTYYHPQMETIAALAQQDSVVGVALLIVHWAIVECQSKDSEVISSFLKQQKIIIRKQYLESVFYNRMDEERRDVVEVYNDLMRCAMTNGLQMQRKMIQKFKYRREFKTGYRLPIRNTEILSPRIRCMCDCVVFGVSVATKCKPVHVREDEYMGGVSVFVYRKDNDRMSTLLYQQEARNVFLRYDDVQNIIFDVPLLCKAFAAYTICVKYTADTHDEAVLLTHMSDQVLSGNVKNSKPVICFSDEDEGSIIRGICFYEV